jgi:glycine cleavage system H protein
VRDEEDGTVVIGITEHAQELLGDLVFVELPEVGDTVDAGNECAVVESVKAASDVYSPVSGEVIAVNEALADAPETVNQDAFGDGWLFQVKLSDPAQLEDLLDAEAYTEIVESEEH